MLQHWSSRGGWKVPGPVDHRGGRGRAHPAGAGGRGTATRSPSPALIRRTQADVWRFVAHLVDRRVGRRPHPGGLPAGRARPGPLPGRRAGEALAAGDRPAHLRRRAAPAGPRRRRRIGDVVGLDDVAEPVVRRRHRHRRRVARLVDDLDVDRRAAFVLTQLLGLPYDEAARVCGVPIGTIRSRVARARADLLAAATATETGESRGVTSSTGPEGPSPLTRPPTQDVLARRSPTMAMTEEARHELYEARKERIGPTVGHHADGSDAPGRLGRRGHRTRPPTARRAHRRSGPMS